MASEPIVSFFVERLNDLLIREALLLPEVDDQFRWIATELSRLRCFLKDADEKQEVDIRMRRWVDQVVDVSYAAEDAIDSFILSERAKIEHMRHGFVGCIKRYSCIFCELKTRRDVGNEIQKVKSEILDISRARITFQIRDCNTVEEKAIQFYRSKSFRKHYEIFRQPDVVGLQEDIETLKGRLNNEEVRRCVISIVGMGGAGKTTLAREVYHDVKKKFDCYAFIYLSQRFSIREILIRIIKSVMSPSEEMVKSNEEDLGMILRDHFSKKRYLVVIDDIWTREAWDSLKVILPDGFNRSRVMLTTHNRDVALYADPSSIPYEKRLLYADESWELFLKRIFWRENTPIACPLELEETGRTILKKCQGLPLAIVVLGAILLIREKTVLAWSKVLDRISSLDWEFSGQLMPILALSYHDLPSYLKACFLYLSAFPEDDRIYSKKLMWLWIAEGFIYERGTNMIEDVAKEYLEQLSDRSMIQVRSRRSDGSVSTFSIHVLLHHLSILEARKNNFFTLAINDPNKKTVRRLALHGPVSESVNHSTPELRSLMCFSNKPTIDLSRPKFLRVLDAEDVRFSEQKLPKEIGKLYQLRYLNLRNTCIDSLPEIGKLFQLRYLNLRNTCIDSLPNSTGKLIYLEILDIRGTRVRPMTATAIQKLERLRYLYMDMDDGSTDGDSLDVSSLRSLRVLSVIRVGQWMEDGLGKLIHLQKLGIYGDLYLYSFAQDLHKLTNLRSLRMGFGFGDELPLLETILSRPPRRLTTLHLERPLQKLPDFDKFPTSLTKLCLKRSLLEQDPMATLEWLPGLQVLKLGCGSFLGKKMECSAGGFPELRFLELDLLDELEEWIMKEGAMPNLQHLVIRLCNRLKELPQGLLHLYHQKELEVTLTEMPETFIAKLQRNKGKEIQLKRSVTMDGNGISMGASSSSQ